jgi:hypothetical protein
LVARGLAVVSVSAGLAALALAVSAFAVSAFALAAGFA